MDALGIFVTSDRYPDYLWPLALAARDKGLAVHIHFSGSGVRLISQADLERLSALAQISVCRESAVQFNMNSQMEAHWPHLLVSAGRMARLVQNCHRLLFI